MRNVLSSNSEVTHFFANNLQSKGKTSNGNLFFENNKIYSYGYHYILGEKLKGGAMFINDRGYSSSTGKHISMLGGSSRHLVKFYYMDINLDEVHDKMLEISRKLPRAWKLKAHYIDQLKQSYEKMLEFIAYDKKYKVGRKNTAFGNYIVLSIDKRDKKFKKCKYIYDQILINLPNYEKEINEQNKKQLIKRQNKEKIQINKFRKNELSNCRLTYDIFRLNCTLDGGYYIYSNQGIKIDLEEAQRSLKMLFSYVDYLKIKIENTDQLMDVSLSGKKIGYYTITSFDGKILKVGCHTIKLSELKNINKLINNLNLN